MGHPAPILATATNRGQLILTEVDKKLLPAATRHARRLPESVQVKPRPSRDRGHAWRSRGLRDVLASRYVFRYRWCQTADPQRLPPPSARRKCDVPDIA